MEYAKKEMLLENYPLPVTIDETNLILDQMKQSICKIHKKKGGKGTCFFCNIPYNNNKIPVLITNYHVIDDEYISNNTKITITIYDDKICKIIELGNNRKIYLSQKYDTAIIEIIPSVDGIYNYLELEENLFQDGSDNYYEMHSIYIIQYPKSQKAAVSYGILKEIRDYDIIHFCCTEDGSSGSPILSILNKKIIGIHKEPSRK